MSILMVMTVDLLYAAFLLIMYVAPVSSMLKDDIEIVTGKKGSRKRRRKEKWSLQKILFLSELEHIEKCHYVVFVLFMGSSLAVLLLIPPYILFEDDIVHCILSGALILNMLSIGIASFVRWNLYKWNVVRPRPPKKGTRH